MTSVKNQHTEVVSLDNGADACFIRPSHTADDAKKPMIVIVHGGPFGASPYQMFLTARQYLLAQGYCLLIINFRGSIGYGGNMMSSLLGQIGVYDVEDCGNLTIKALE